MGSDATRPVFVTSLSAAKNELSQWRACGGGTGSFALGFNVTSMLEMMEEDQKPINCYKCIYDEVQSLGLSRPFVDRLLESFRAQRAASKPGGNDFQKMMDLVHEAVRLFDTLAPLIKHPDFIAEAEWRLVSDPVDLKKRPIRLREGKTAIVGPNCQRRRALTFPHPRDA